MQRKIKRVIICFVCIVCMVTGCVPQKTNDYFSSEGYETSTSLEMKTIIINSYFIELIGMTQEEFYESLRGTSQYSFDTVTKLSNGDISVTGSSIEFQKVVDNKMQELKKIKQDFSELAENYNIIVSNNYSEVNFYYNLDLDVGRVWYYFIAAAGDAAYCQVFSPDNEENQFDLTMNIYNSDTGKLVISHNVYDMGEYLYKESDWEASYE